MSHKPIAVGPLTVSFSRDPFCCNILDAMYGELPRSSSDVDIRIIGYDWRVTGIPQNGIIRASEDISIDSDVHYIKKIRSYSSPKSWVIDRIGQRGYAIEIGGWKTETLSIKVYYDGTLYEERLAPIQYFLKIKNRTFANYQDGLGKHFVYDVFEPLWQAWMVKNGYSFIHAASVSINNQGVILTGSSHTGKTSIISTLIRHSDNVKFLSDDLAIVTDKGDLYPYYKSSVIYAYNIAGGTLPESGFFTGFSDRVQWNWRKWRYGEGGVRRRVPPEELFGGQIGSAVPRKLETVIYLSREEREQFSHESVPPEELARRSTGVILNELDWLVEYSSAVCSAGSTSITPQNIIKKTENIYQDCFRDVETILLRIPTNARAEVLNNYVESII